jgi:scaffold protein (connect acetoacetyl-CoA thiolase and HMG-CoA synthase)
MTARPFNDIAYNQFLNEEKLMGCRCRKCGERYVPPRPLCVKCFSPDLDWMEMNGRGSLVAFTCIAIAPPFMIAQGYGRKHPYISGVVELADGGRVDARIEGVDPSEPESIRIGMPMKATFIHRRNIDVPETYLAFEPD